MINTFFMYVSDFYTLGQWLPMAVSDSVFECPNCGNRLEFDFKECLCGLKNDMPI